jgi:acyl-CoA reductase-like NAD-dependent aldehyde dehydrogenase
MNSGQACIAPTRLLVHSKLEEVNAIAKEVAQQVRVGNQKMKIRMWDQWFQKAI